MKKVMIALAAAGSLSLGACASNDSSFASASDGVTGAGTACPSVGRTAAAGAGVGALGGAGVGAVVGGINPLEGAIIGAVVGGLAGAIWADSNNDGCVDGYMVNGQYYEGSPDAYQPAPPVTRRGERG